MPEFTAAQELAIREQLALNIELLNTANSPVGFVQPSPTYVNDVSEFWAVFDATQNTKKEIDTSSVAGCWLYPLFYEDVPEAGCMDNPLIRLTYEIYLFRQYGLTRLGDNGDPMVEIFDTKVLVSHNLFIAAWLGIRNTFQGKRNITGLSGFTTSQTTSIVQSEDVQHQAICEFVPGIVGFAVKMRETCELLLA